MESEDMDCVDLSVPEKSKNKLCGRGGKKLQRIQQTFDVCLEMHGSSTSEVVRIRGPRASVNKAQHYVKTLCGTEEKVVERRIAFPADMRDELIGTNEQLHRALEADSGAVVQFLECEAVITGNKVMVEVAAEPLQDKIMLCKQLRQKGVDIKDYVNHRPAVVSAMLHVDASTAGQSAMEESSDNDSTSGQPDAKLIQYGVDLGWTEEEVTAVVVQLGGSPDKNCLLNHLLKRFPGSASGSSSPISSPARTSGEVSVNHSTASRPLPARSNSKNLRPIVIDGSNVAMAHSNGKFFSCRGIQKCVEYFQDRGHTEITCFVPMWRKETSRPESPISDQELLLRLQQENIVVFTPSRRIKGKRVTCYDDRYVVQLADETGGIIVSNDNYRDLQKEKKQWRVVIDERLLMYTFAQDRFMPPADPLGSKGPALEAFLRFPDADGSSTAPLAKTVCPFDVTCTYGSKCKYGLHPQRDQKTSTHRSSPLSIVQRVMQHENPDLVPKGLPESRKPACPPPTRCWDTLAPEEYPVPPPPPTQAPTQSPYPSYDSQTQQLYSNRDMHFTPPAPPAPQEYFTPPAPPAPQEYFSRGPSAAPVSHYTYAPPYDMPSQPTEQYSPFYQSQPTAQADMFMDHRHMAPSTTYQHPSDMYSMPPPPPPPSSEPQHIMYQDMSEREAYHHHHMPTSYSRDPHDQYTMAPSQWPAYSSMSNHYPPHPQQHMMPTNSYNSFADEAVRAFSNHFQERIIREVVRLNPHVNDMDVLYQRIISFIQKQHQPM